MKGLYKTTDAFQTEELGKKFAVDLLETDRKNVVVAFFGGMGMGKTAFVKGMAKGLEFKGEVTSPTFAIVHEYIGGKVPLYHFDMYRVETFDGFYSCGFYDYLDNGIIAVEWSENIENALPEDAIIIRFERGKEDNEREITIK